MGGKVILGMSGGVDSSAAAILLKEAGYEVTGLTFSLWSGDEDHIKDAKQVAENIGIAHITVDCSERFKKYVMEYFAKEYYAGRTPNPCVVCNRFVKWQVLFEAASELGAEHIATGHYARILQYPKTGLKTPAEAKFIQKDQSYVLYRLSKEQLSCALMPLGDYTKPEIRAIAEAAGLSVAQKKDSQEICFIPDNDYAKFLAEFTGRIPERGSFVDSEGNILGEHEGIINYTVGQRKGLKISFGERRFVQKTDAANNTVILGSNEDLFKTSLRASGLSLTALENIDGVHCSAKIRYGNKKTPCKVKMLSQDEIQVDFEQPVRAVTPGQSVVFYDGEFLLGGATIEEAL